MKTEIEPLFDALAVNIKTLTVRILSTSKPRREAEAIANMAVIRRGCDVEFYPEAPAGKFQEGDKWTCEMEVASI